MGVKFAGSKSLDDRRRRRLASESESPQSSPTPKCTSNAGYWKLRRAREDDYEYARSPIVSLLPHKQLRVYLMICGLPLLLIAAMLGVQHLELPTSHALSSAFSFKDGFVWRFHTGMCLVGCGAVCWLISWFRSASVRDFEGCFKSWYWSGWAFLIFGIAGGTDLHVIGARLVAEYARIEIGFLQNGLWLVPVAALLLDPVRSFTQEMWHSRRSWMLFLATLVSGLAYLGLKLTPSEFEIGLTTPQHEFLLALASSLTPTLMFTALVSQTHYVMYVSSDPVQKRQSWTVRAIRYSLSGVSHGVLHGSASIGQGMGVLFAVPKKKKKRRSQAQPEDASEETEEPEVKAESKTTKPAARSRIRSRRKAAAAKPVKDAATTEDVETEVVQEVEEQEEAVTAPVEKKKSRGWFGRKATPVVSDASEESAETEVGEPEETQHQSRSKRAQARSQRQAAKSQSPVEEVEEKIEPQQQKVSKPARGAKPRIRVKTAPEPQVEEKPTPPPEPKQIEQQNSSESINLDSLEEGERLDPEMLKGLSKKEKRRLRKLHRDRERERKRAA